MRTPGIPWLRRAADSLRAGMRKEMRRLLSGHGVSGRSGPDAARHTVDLLEAAGGRGESPRIVASWEVRETAADSLLSWSRKSGLAGARISAEVKTQVLEQLAEWGERRFGGLHSVKTSEESYEITVIRT